MSKASENSYYVVQRWMISELSLNGTELALYAIIHGFSQPGSDQCFCGGLGYLSDMTGKDRSSVIRNLQSLTAKGYIEKKEVVQNNVKFCKYRAAIVKSHGCAEMQPGVAKCDGGSGKMQPNNKDNNKEVSKDKSLDTKSDEGYTPEFEQFWKAYPKRNGKKQGKFPAFKSFLKIKTPLETLLAALELHKRSQQWADGYIPDAVTWLNQRRWEDEIDPSSLLPAEQKRKVLKTKINEEGEEVAYYEEP